MSKAAAVSGDIEENRRDEDASDTSGNDQTSSGIRQNRPNKFSVLCDGVVNATALLHASLQEFLEFKDELLKHFLPPSVLLKFSMTSSKIFRSVTDFYEPVNELIRMVREYSTPWEEKSAALRKMHDDFQKKKRQLDVSIKRLSLIDAMTSRAVNDRKITNWEKLYCKVTTAKSHGRRWKYTIETLREKAKLGYEVLVHYVDHIHEGNEEFPDLAALKTDLPESQMDTISEEANDSVPSRQDQSFGGKKSELSDSQPMEEASLRNGSAATPQQAAPPLPPQPPPPLKVETASAQVWTDEGQYDTELRVRVYCPKGFDKKDLRCFITYGAQFVRTPILDGLLQPVVLEASKPVVELPKKQGGKLARKNMPAPMPAPDKPKAQELPPERYEELSFPMKGKRVGLRMVAAQVDNLNVALHCGPDEDMIAMATLEACDIENVEMPVVYNIKDQGAEACMSELDQRIYAYDCRNVADSLPPRPTQFPLYPVQGGKSDSERKPCGHLPLYFYYLRTWHPKALDRSIGTSSFRDVVLEATGLDIYDLPTEPEPPVRFEKGISPMPPQTPSVHEASITLEQHDAIVTNHQKAVAEMQDAYEEKIEALLSQLQVIEELALQQQQLQPAFDRDLSLPVKPRSAQQFVFQRKDLPKKRLLVGQRLPKWGENLPADFFERMELFKEESYEHKKILYEHVTQQIRDEYEKKLAFQHKASRNVAEAVDTAQDVSLPALFMPFRGRNVYNPRARQYFHPSGTTGSRLTQPPSMMSLPPLKNQISLVNLFQLGNSMHNPSWLLQHYLESKTKSTMRPNTADENGAALNEHIEKAAIDLMRVEESET